MAGGLAAAHRSGAIGSRAARLFPRSGTRLALRNPAVPGRGRNGRGLSGPRSAAWPAHRHQGSQWRVGHRGPTLFVEARGTGRAPDSAPQRLPRLRPGPYGSHARPQRRIPDDGVARRRDAQPKAPPRGRTDRAPEPGPRAMINPPDDPNDTADMANDGPAFAGFAWTSYAERLQAAGVSWKVYQEYDNYSDNPLAFCRAFRGVDRASHLYRRGRDWVAGST